MATNDPRLRLSNLDLSLTRLSRLRQHGLRHRRHVLGQSTGATRATSDARQLACSRNLPPLPHNSSSSSSTRRRILAVLPTHSVPDPREQRRDRDGRHGPIRHRLRDLCLLLRRLRPAESAREGPVELADRVLQGDRRRDAAPASPDTDDRAVERGLLRT